MSQDFLQGTGAVKTYLVGAGAGAGKNSLKTAPKSRESEPWSRAILVPEPVKRNHKTAPSSHEPEVRTLFFRGPEPRAGSR